jgi:hypothetical protein
LLLHVARETTNLARGLGRRFRRRSGHPSLGADDARLMSGGGCCDHELQGKTRQGGLLTTQRHSNEGSGGGEASLREIEGGGARAERRQRAPGSRSDVGGDFLEQDGQR